VFDATWNAPHAAGWKGQVQYVVDYAALHHLMELAANDGTTAQVRAVARQALDEFAKSWKSKAAQGPARRAAFAYGIDLIAKFRENPKDFAPKPALEPPPGQPIGDTACDWDSPLDLLLH
jgi:hypothetical protein